MAMSASEFNRRMREAQRKAERDIKREIDRVNRENQRRVADYNRKVDAQNRAEVERVNRENQRRVDAHNREAERHNKRVIADLNSRLKQGARSTVGYKPEERALVERVHGAINFDDGKQYDVFLSYARIDGEDTAQALMAALTKLDVSVWFDAVAIQPGKSQSLQMDAGLQKAGAGIAILTPAYLAGRFWTQRELGALLHKPTLIPVLHGVTFDDVKEYSGILPDLAGFTTSEDDIPTIAQKIAPAVTGPTF